MKEYLSRTRLRTRFLYQVDLVGGVVESSNVGIRTGFLAKLQDSEFRMFKDLARAVDLGVANCDCGRHGL